MQVNTLDFRLFEPIGIAALFLLICATPSVNADIFSDLKKQANDAVRRGVEDGMRRSGGIGDRPSPRQGDSGGFNLFGGGALQPYQDPGPDEALLEYPQGVSVGNFRQSANSPANLATLAFPKSGELDNPDFDKDVVMASVQWACFGQLRQADKPAYLQELLGADNNPELARRNDPKARAYRVQQINTFIKSINDTLAGKDASVQMARMSTVYGNDPARKQREIDQAIARSKTMAVDKAAKLAVEIVALNPNSATAGRKALDLLATTLAKVDVAPSQEASCALNYLEDRYGGKSDDQVIDTYRAILATGTANPGNISASAVSCPVAASLATKLMDAQRYDDAFRVVSSASRLARQRFDKSDMRSFSWPTQSCRYVTWLEGMMYFHGMGVAASPHSAGDAFRQCADGLEVCAYDLATLLATGQAPAAGNGEMKRMLQIASSSRNPGRSAKARDLLAQYEKQIQDAIDAGNRQVCENTSDAGGGKSGEPSAREMCKAYLAYMDSFTAAYNGLPGSMTGVPGMQTVSEASQHLAGGKVAYMITDFSKDSCKNEGARLLCRFNRSLRIKFEWGPLASEAGMPLGERDRGYFTKSGKTWKVDPIRYTPASTTVNDDKNCMDTSWLTPTEAAVAGAFGCIK